MKSVLTLTLVLLFGLLITVGCENYENPFNSVLGQETLANLSSKVNSNSSSFSAPSPLVTVTSSVNSMTFWPYTGTSFNGAPQDPINLIFLGEADPIQIREALMSLDGNRTAFGFPDQAPFNEVWTDAIGDVQTGYSQDFGWTGGAIQLSCGGYGPIRFHIRLFRMNGYTVANAHFELLIPGTTDHQVLNWELAEQFITADFARSGLLGAAPETTAEINQPNHFTIPAVVYNLLPVELRAAIGGPLEDVNYDVPRLSDGKATILTLAGSVPVTADYQVQDFIVEFDQAIPKPFCSDGPYDYLYVTGQVHMYQVTQVNEAGKYIMTFEAEGELTAVPINPLTGQPTGTPFSASVKERHASKISDNDCSASSWIFQKLFATSGANSGSITKRLQINSNGNFDFTEDGDCRNDMNISAGG